MRMASANPIARRAPIKKPGFWTAKPLVANIARMLDDFTDAKSGARLVPGSQVSERRDYGPEDTIAAEGSAGYALIFDGRPYHGSSTNVTEREERRIILSYFCRPFLRRQKKYFWGLDPEIRRTEREAFLHRLGFSIWGGLGRTHDPDDKACWRSGTSRSARSIRRAARWRISERLDRPAPRGGVQQGRATRGPLADGEGTLPG